jgi:hypothetical protein
LSRPQIRAKLARAKTENHPWPKIRARSPDRGAAHPDLPIWQAFFGYGGDGPANVVKERRVPEKDRPLTRQIRAKFAWAKTENHPRPKIRAGSPDQSAGHPDLPISPGFHEGRGAGDLAANSPGSKKIRPITQQIDPFRRKQ